MLALRSLAAGCAALAALLAGSTPALATTIDFKDDPEVGSNITCNPAYLAYECDPAHHAWLKSKGIDVVGSDPGFVWSTRIGGVLGEITNLVTFVSPNHLSSDGFVAGQGITIQFLNGPVSNPSADLTVVPSEYISGAPATVTADALDASGAVLASTTLTWVGVSNHVWTPATNIAVAATGVSALRLTATTAPYDGLFLVGVHLTDATPPAPVICAPGDQAFCHWMGACNAAGTACDCRDPAHWWAADNCASWQEVTTPMGPLCRPGARSSCSWQGTCNAAGDSCNCDDPTHFVGAERCATWHASTAPAGASCKPGDGSTCSWMGTCKPDGSSCVCNDPAHWSPADHCATWHP